MDRVKLIVTSRPEALEPAVKSMMEFGAVHKVGIRIMQDMHLCLEELFVNILNYAWEDKSLHEIELEFGINGEYFELTISDNGKPFDLFSAPPPDLDTDLERRTIGGLGIHLVRNLTDQRHYLYANGRNVVVLRKLIDTHP